MFEDFHDWIINLGPISSGIISAAIFGAIVWLGKIIINWLVSLFKQLKKSQDVSKVTKYWLHKNYLHSNGLYFFAQGYLYIIYRALQSLFFSFLLITLYFGTTSLLKLNLVDLYFSVIVFIVLNEGYSWLKDQSSENILKNVNPETKKTVLEKLGDPFEDLQESMIGKENRIDQEKEPLNSKGNK